MCLKKGNVILKQSIFRNSEQQKKTDVLIQFIKNHLLYSMDQ